MDGCLAVHRDRRVLSSSDCRLRPRCCRHQLPPAPRLGNGCSKERLWVAEPVPHQHSRSAVLPRASRRVLPPAFQTGGRVTTWFPGPPQKVWCGGPASGAPAFISSRRLTAHMPLAWGPRRKQLWPSRTSSSPGRVECPSPASSVTPWP